MLVASAGTGWALALKHVHTGIGILVGLLTIVYLTIKICQELKRNRAAENRARASEGIAKPSAAGLTRRGET